MTNLDTIASEEIKYSKLLSSLFCSTSIIVLSILCLLNNLSFDIYSACTLMKTVIPGSFCFWFFGVIIGKILDKHGDAPIKKEVKLSSNNDAYKMPSMFAADNMQSDDSELGDL